MSLRQISMGSLLLLLAACAAPSPTAPAGNNDTANATASAAPPPASPQILMVPQPGTQNAEGMQMAFTPQAVPAHFVVEGKPPFNLLRSTATGQAFPAAVDGFMRLPPRLYNAAGTDISVGYKFAMGAPTATIYVFPLPPFIRGLAPGGDMAQLARAEFDQRKTTLQGNNVSNPHSEAPFNFPQPDYKMSGWHYTYQTTDQSGPVQSELFVFCCVNDNLIEYRFTYPQSWVAAPLHVPQFIRDLKLTIPHQ